MMHVAMMMEVAKPHPRSIETVTSSYRVHSSNPWYKLIGLISAIFWAKVM
jgi:hypothetical protein